jgi:hypothetical protein
MAAVNVHHLPAPEKPTASIVMVTPAVAARWLERNTGNRRFKPQEIDRYARDMTAGHWRITGEAIKFARSGRLLDGQNRLAAVAKSGTTIPMFVVRGLEDEAQRVMDTGSKRNSADDLQMFAGEKNASALAAAIRFAITAELVGPGGSGRYSVSNMEVATFLEENPAIRGAVEVAKDVYRQMDAFPAVVAYAYWKLAAIDPLDADEFFGAAATGAGLSTGDPILAMRKRFAEARRNRERLPHATQLSIIYRVWNAWRDGKTMTFVRVKSPKAGGGDVSIPTPK